MEREKQIENEASRIAGVHPDWTKIECMRIGFKEGARWADKHPVSHPVEIRCSKERIQQIKDLYEKHYQSVVITLIEEGHSKEEIAMIFFELGARAADENPIRGKEEANGFKTS